MRYIGFTSDLKRRIRDHNSGNGGEFTKRNFPFKLVFFEAFLSEVDARAQEQFYKTGYGREVLNGKIQHSLANCQIV